MAPKPREEAAENNGMQRYYLITFVMFGMLSVYCYGFASTWETYTCLINDELEVQVAQAQAEAAAAAAGETGEGGRRLLDLAQND
mmetsp:Transcript_8970/g.15184  ORF Transcript_8970/g.15184 Transcript_8970/m.15184 type:complete len:85 (+) Transcript_8970:17-271(+)